MPKKATPNIKCRKYGGDDAYSWAVFVNGIPKFTGLSKRSAAHMRDSLIRQDEESIKKG